MNSYRLLGKDFLKMLSLLQSSKGKGFYFASGIKQNLSILKNGQSRSLTSVTWMNGTAINPNATI
jgi:hypothetical protein